MKEKCGKRMISRKQSAIAILQMISVLYIVVWSISPPLQIDLIYRLMAVVCAGFWFVAAIIRHLKFRDKDMYLMIFLLWTFIISTIYYGGFKDALADIALYILIMVSVMYTHYANKMYEIKFIHIVVLGLLIIWNSITWRALLVDDHIMRYLVRNDTSFYSYMRQGVGGYGLIYSQVCIFPSVLSWIKSSVKKNRICMFIGSVWLISYMGIVINASYSIAILSTCISIYIIFFNRSRKPYKMILIITIFLIIGVYSLVRFESFRDVIIEFFNSQTIENKINDLLLSFTNEEVEGSFLARYSRYKSSCITFLSYPITGGLWWEGSGGHSAILDMFARFGIVGGIVSYKMLTRVPYMYISRTKNFYVFNTCIATYVSIIFVGVLNSFSYQFIPLLILVMPLFFNDITVWKENKKDESIMGS